MELLPASPHRSPEPSPHAGPASAEPRGTTPTRPATKQPERPSTEKPETAVRGPQLPEGCSSRIRELFERLEDPRTVAGCIIVRTRRRTRSLLSEAGRELEPAMLVEQARWIYFRLSIMDSGACRTIQGFITEIRHSVRRATDDSAHEPETGRSPVGSFRTDELAGWRAAPPYGRMDGRKSRLQTLQP